MRSVRRKLRAMGVELVEKLCAGPIIAVCQAVLKQALRRDGVE
jgi:hypothetical protein